MPAHANSRVALAAENTRLRRQLREAQAALRAIREAQVDALVLGGPAGERVVPFPGADSPYQVMVESLNEGAVTVLAGGTIGYCNPRFAQMAQQPAEALVGADFQALLPPEEQAAFAALLRPAELSQARGEFHLRRPDGSQAPVLLSGHALYAPGLEAVVIVVTDLTERIQAEAQRQFQAQLLAAVGQAVIATDLAGRIIHWNPAAERIYGWPAAEVLGRDVIEIIGSQATQEQAVELMAHLAAGHDWAGEFEVARRDGSAFPVYVTDSPILDQAGRLAGVIGVSIDITQRKQAEAALRESERDYRDLFENSVVGICHVLPGGNTFLRVNQAFAAMYGYASPEQMLAEVTDIGRQIYASQPDRQGFLRQLDSASDIPPDELEVVRRDGSHFYVLVAIQQVRDSQGQLRFYQGAHTDITRRKQADLALRESEKNYRELFDNSIVGISQALPNGRLVRVNKTYARLYGYDSPEEMVAHITNVGHNLYVHPEERQEMMDILEAGGRLEPREIQVVRRDGARFWVLLAVQAIRDTAGDVLYYQATHSDITYRKQAELEVHQRLAELEAVQRISSALRTAQTAGEMMPILLDETLAVLGAEAGAIWLLDKAGAAVRLAVARGWYTQPAMADAARLNEGITAQVMRTRQPHLTREFTADPVTRSAVRALTPAGWGGAVVPIQSEQAVVGFMHIAIPLPRLLLPPEIHLLTTLTEIAGSAIQRSVLHEQTARRMQELAALSEIDRAIVSTFDIQVVLAVLVDKVITLLDVDAADILLVDAQAGRLRFSAGKGFRGLDIQSTELRLGAGYAGRAALERRVIHVPDLRLKNDSPRLAKAQAREAFVSYSGFPLLAKGQIKGVLEIFQRQPFEPDAEWLNFLDALAGQAAIAIDNAALFGELQRSNTDLVLAYDATIEGWSRALDLRDKETEGHSLRVTDKTIQLARVAGLNDSDLAQLRWGALLHDIGKMGVPDRILLKPGPLTDDEWVIMKQHPTLAYQMLSPIQHLRSALDIPYCHHEKWDGSGYPRGLKAEAIPLAARLFAIVDVWDALMSDRPYRRAWPAAQVREFLQGQAGTHFDPRLLQLALGSGVLDKRQAD